MSETEPVYNRIPYLENDQLNEFIRYAQESIRAKERLRGSEPISWDSRQTLEQAVRRGEEAFEQIIGSNLDRVYKEARRRIRLLPWDELEQAGVLGMYRAVASFDPGKSEFSTHATNNIRWAILEAIQSEQGFSDDDVKKIRQISNFELFYMQTQGRKPSEEEIAHGLSLPKDKVRLMQELRARQWQPSTDGPIAPGSETSWGDFISDGSISPEEAAETLEIFQMVIDYLKGRGDVVPEHILMLVQHIWGYMTYEEIGKAHGVSKTRIEQIIKRLYVLLEYPLRDYKPPKRKLR